MDNFRMIVFKKKSSYYWLLLVISACLSLIFTSCDASPAGGGGSGDSDGGDVEPDIHMAGYTDNYVPAYWLNGTRVELSVIDPTRNGTAYSVFVHGGVVYVSGYTQDATGMTVATYWTNGTRTDVDLSKEGFAESIYITE